MATGSRGAENSGHITFYATISRDGPTNFGALATRGAATFNMHFRKMAFATDQTTYAVGNVISGTSQ